jgi:hypothetical protein
MKCLFLLLLLTINVYTSASNTEKKFKRKLRKINDVYSLIDSEMTMDLPKIQEVERPFPLDDSDSLTNSLRFTQSEVRNSFGMHTNLKTFGTDYDIKPQLIEKKEVTYKKPIYFDPMGTYKSVNVDNSKENEDETNFLETFSNTGSSSSYVNQSKEIVFNSNQVDYEPSSYRSAYVLGQNPSNIKRHSSSKDYTSQIGDKILTPSHSENKRNKLTSSSINDDTHKGSIIEIKKLENKKIYLNNFNSTSQKLNLSNHQNINSTHANNYTDANYESQPFFKNEKEINDLSLKLSNLFKNILFDIVHNKNIDKVIQNSSEEANREIKNSFKKMRKNREFRKHSDISNIKDLGDKIFKYNKTQKNNSESNIKSLKLQSEITKKVLEKIENNKIKPSKEIEANKFVNLNETNILKKSEIKGINMIQKSSKLKKVDNKNSLLKSTMEKEKILSLRVDKEKEKIKLNEKKIPLPNSLELRKNETTVNNLLSIKKSDLIFGPNKIIDGKIITKKKEITSKLITTKKSEVLLKPKEKVLSSNTTSPLKDLKSNKKYVNIFNRSSITEIEKQILSKIPKKLVSNNSVNSQTKINQDHKIFSIDKSTENNSLKYKSKVSKTKPILKESHIDKMIKDNAEKLKKIKEASEKLKAKLNLKSPMVGSNKHNVFEKQLELKIKNQKELNVKKTVSMTKTSKKIKEMSKTSIKEEFDDSSMISELLKNLEK